jgi:hypothetical protein
MGVVIWKGRVPSSKGVGGVPTSEDDDEEEENRRDDDGHG